MPEVSRAGPEQQASALTVDNSPALDTSPCAPLQHCPSPACQSLELGHRFFLRADSATRPAAGPRVFPLAEALHARSPRSVNLQPRANVPFDSFPTCLSALVARPLRLEVQRRRRVPCSAAPPLHQEVFLLNRNSSNSPACSPRRPPPPRPAACSELRSRPTQARVCLASHNKPSSNRMPAQVFLASLNSSSNRTQAQVSLASLSSRSNNSSNNNRSNSSQT